MAHHRQVPLESVEYWHVELDSHDVILAEGLAAESYLDTGNRGRLFQQWRFRIWKPTRTSSPSTGLTPACPLVLDGPEIHQAKTQLLARAQSAGAMR